ncbi:MAG: tetratricopeptide repeat protein [Thiomicrorhabdus sp.]|nr:tetratricopeptide repeat protein [Thiomicrorhabdus sp.]
MNQQKQSMITAIASLVFVFVFILGIGFLSEKTETVVPAIKKITLVDPKSQPNQHARQAKAIEIEQRFNQAVIMLHSKQYDNAIKALHRVLELAPRMPEAHVNMGYAFLDGGNAKAARDFFASAIELNLNQLNAYYGLAMASEVLGDMESALGAMRTYVHLSPKDDPYVAKARAALWEWQAAREQTRNQAVQKEPPAQTEHSIDTK